VFVVARSGVLAQLAFERSPASADAAGESVALAAGVLSSSWPHPFDSSAPFLPAPSSAAPAPASRFSAACAAVSGAFARLSRAVMSAFYIVAYGHRRCLPSSPACSSRHWAWLRRSRSSAGWPPALALVVAREAWRTRLSNGSRAILRSVCGDASQSSNQQHTRSDRRVACELRAPSRVRRSASRSRAPVPGSRQAARQRSHTPQKVISASSTGKAVSALACRHGALPTTHSTSWTAPHVRHTRWWWLSPTRVS
jgi:hypothetical protein